VRREARGLAKKMRRGDASGSNQSPPSDVAPGSEFKWDLARATTHYSLLTTHDQLGSCAIKETTSGGFAFFTPPGTMWVQVQGGSGLGWVDGCGPGGGGLAPGPAGGHYPIYTTYIRS
jgi:hypothetical protein